MYFFELHEGDEDLMSDVILARDEPMAADEFASLVDEIRRRVQDSFEEDTIIEAIAVELERDHGFVYVSDDRIAASVRVSALEGETRLIERDDDDWADDDTDEELPDYRGVYADFDPDARPS